MVVDGAVLNRQCRRQGDEEKASRFDLLSFDFERKRQKGRQ